jgi:hypothetical protein
MEEELDNLAFRFFKLFAQYESSLKSEKYFQTNNSGKILVDWDRFANERIGSDFIEELGEKAGAATYILDHPPKKQVVGDQGLIEWQEVPNNDRSVQMLFGHISRIRNNLYHGAKFNGTWFDPDRSYQLLKNGLVILEFFKGRTNIN